MWRCRFTVVIFASLGPDSQQVDCYTENPFGSTRTNRSVVTTGRAVGQRSVRRRVGERPGRGRRNSHAAQNGLRDDPPKAGSIVSIRTCATPASTRRPFEDVHRLPKHDPRRVGPVHAERRLRKSLEDLSVLIGIDNLPGELQGGVVMIKRLVIPGVRELLVEVVA